MTGQESSGQDPEASEVRLALVTCGPQLEVALSAAACRTISLVRLGGVAPRSTLVLAAIDLLVEDAGLTGESISEIVVSRGPGSFTGIRSGLATAAGLVAAVGARCLAYESLVMLAARCAGPAQVWCAQPGRRGEVYARHFEISGEQLPRALGNIEILSISKVADRGPWSAAEALDLGDAERVTAVRSSAEALMYLAETGLPGDDAEPLYVEGPPISTRKSES
ncbi:MAG: tRNA (adenosine(37)-N6)-threonylcarbamoyltransferase complex dimerization subunit type 1 TsaB [Acidobacteria bacterium]|jgi:tRNA threonylcarbamoyl adenosine modification protein YeaZ|nr:tRNA (adenosine(37)-N6)-threonylcarbamoyltransferase complex dimerization subunit type 1 TsaB [Acidobacteriota bacterium]